MQGYVLKRSGKSEVLKLQALPEPEVQAGQIKIKVQYIGINYAEVLSRKGQYSWAPKRPYTPGMEGFGQVVAIGEGVTQHQVNDWVVFGGQYGGYAEYTVVPAFMAFAAPAGYTPEQSAALLVNYMTAWVALVRLARIQPTDKVLIQAAAGGVGTAAVQIAAKWGCEVFGTAGAEEKLLLLKKLGASLAINYRTDDFYDRLEKYCGGVDVVLEMVGGEVFRKSKALLLPFGRIVVAGYASIPFNKWNPWSWWLTWKEAPKVQLMAMAKKTSGIMATHIGYLTQNQQVVQQQYQAMVQFIETHDIKPVVGRVFDFAELPQAHAFMESRQSTGKILVKVH